MNYLLRRLKNTSTVLFFILLLIVIALHFIILHFSIFIYWEEMVTYPWLVSQGLLPYRDIFVPYTPGIFYILGFFYKILGYSFSSLHTIGYCFFIITDCLLCITSYKLFRSLKITLGIMLFYILWHPVFEGKTLWFETIYTPLLILAYFFLARWFTSQKDKHLLIASILFGCGLLIKQQVIWVFGVGILGIIFGSYPFSIQNIIKRILLFSFTPIVFVLGSFGIFYLLKAGNEYFFATIQFSLQHYAFSDYFRLLPNPVELKLIAPAFTVSGLLFLLACFNFKKAKIYFFTLLWIVATCMSAYPRWGLFHMQVSIVFLSIGLGYVLQEAQIRARRLPGKFIISGIVIFIAAISIQSLAYYYVVRIPGSTQLDEKYFDSLKKEIKNGIGDNDFYSLENAHLLYFLLNKKPTVLPWVAMLPVFTEIPELQEKQISQLEIQKIHYIVYLHSNKSKKIADDPSIPTLLKKYILINYNDTNDKRDTLTSILIKK